MFCSSSRILILSHSASSHHFLSLIDSLVFCCGTIGSFLYGCWLRYSFTLPSVMSFRGPSFSTTWRYILFYFTSNYRNRSNSVVRPAIYRAPALDETPFTFDQVNEEVVVQSYLFRILVYCRTTRWKPPVENPVQLVIDSQDTMIPSAWLVALRLSVTHRSLN